MLTPLTCLVDPVVPGLLLLNVWRSLQLQTCSCHMKCVCGTFQLKTTVFSTEQDDAIREWRKDFTEQARRAISRIHTNLGHPQNSTLAKMISDAGGSEEMIKCATQYPCCVQKGCLGLDFGVLCQFQGQLVSDGPDRHIPAPMAERRRDRPEGQWAPLIKQSTQHRGSRSRGFLTS